MKQILKYLKSLGLTFTIILISSIILSLICYYANVNNGFTNFIKLIIPIISIFISSFILGKNTQKKGFIEGLKLSLIFLGLIFVISLMVKLKLEITTFIYYILIILSSMLGASIGINIKPNQE